MKSDRPHHSSDLPSAADSTAIEAAAAAWLVRRQAGFEAGDEVRFQAWLASHPQCGAAWAELERAWATISYPGQTGKIVEARCQLETLRRQRRRQGLAIAGIGLAAAAAFMIMLVTPWAPAVGPSPEPAIVAVRPDKQVLPDGSVVERNARTDIEVDYSAQQRLVRLIRGEALFTVAHDSSRPFLVVAGGVGVRAVGTEFAVRYGTEHVNVLVTEGQVAVTKIAADAPAGKNTPSPAPAPALMAPVYVTAGKHVVMPFDLPPSAAPEIKPMAAEEITTALAWRGQRLEFTRTPLAKVAELFNRRNRLQFAIGDAATGELRITGLFWADDPEGFVRLLESGFNVTAERTGDLIRLRQP